MSETFDWGAFSVGDKAEQGNEVICLCFHEVTQTIEGDVEKVKFFAIAFQCDVILAAVRGFEFDPFQVDLFAYYTYDGEAWRAGTVVNGYLGEMSGDLKADSDNDFFDDDD